MEAKEAIAWFVFVDFENVPELDLGLVAGKPVHVTLLIGKNQRKLDLTLVRQIHRLARQVELVEVGASGHNALDLTLSFYLGQAVQRDPGAQFGVVSKDKDFDPMSGHLQGVNLKVARFADFLHLPFLPRPRPPGPTRAAAVTKPAAEDRPAKVMARLKNSVTPNRPATQKALLRHIKAALGKTATEVEAEEMIRRLCEERALEIDPRGKVAYAAV
jgi:hypothetical protein